MEPGGEREASNTEPAPTTNHGHLHTAQGDIPPASLFAARLLGQDPTVQVLYQPQHGPTQQPSPDLSSGLPLCWAQQPSPERPKLAC